MDLDSTPALDPPAGKTSNFIDPVSMRQSRYVACSVGVALVTIFVFIRIYVRILVKKFNSEDWVLLFAYSTFMVLEAMLILVAKYGDGTHQWDITMASMVQVLYYENIAEIFYCLTMFPIKYVVLHHVKSIFVQHGTNSLSSLLITVLIWANLFLNLSLGLAFLFSCTPRTKIYNPWVEGTCISQMACMSALGALNIASDLSILVVPLFGISKLQVPLKKKLLAGSVFAVGIFATAASVVRFYYGLLLANTDDRTWAFMPIGNWTSIEFMTGFIVAGSPYLPRFLSHIFGAKNLQTQNSSGQPSGYHRSNFTNTFQSIRRPNDSFSALKDHDQTGFDDAIRLDSTSGNSHITISAKALV